MERNNNRQEIEYERQRGKEQAILITDKFMQMNRDNWRNHRQTLQDAHERYLNAENRWATMAIQQREENKNNGVVGTVIGAAAKFVNKFIG